MENIGIKPICNYCNQEINEFGSILFSDPKILKLWMKLALIDLNPPEIVLKWLDFLPEWELAQKFHICKKCYDQKKPHM